MKKKNGLLTTLMGFLLDIPLYPIFYKVKDQIRWKWIKLLYLNSPVMTSIDICKDSVLVGEISKTGLGWLGPKLSLKYKKIRLTINPKILLIPMIAKLNWRH